MKTFLVTVKLDKRSNHDPRSKLLGVCPAQSHAFCDDSTGEHHTLIFVTDDDHTRVTDVRELYALNFHVTRVENVTRNLRTQDDLLREDVVERTEK